MSVAGPLLLPAPCALSAGGARARSKDASKDDVTVRAWSMEIINAVKTILKHNRRAEDNVRYIGSVKSELPAELADTSTAVALSAGGGLRARAALLLLPPNPRGTRQARSCRSCLSRGRCWSGSPRRSSS